jgi:hypothetical protein
VQDGTREDKRSQDRTGQDGQECALQYIFQRSCCKRKGRVAAPTASPTSINQFTKNTQHAHSTIYCTPHYYITDLP